MASQSDLSVSAWIPYWSQQDGIPALQSHLDSFDIISPFAYEVQTDGTLADKSKIATGTWNTVFSLARTKNIQIIPSILWADKNAIHEVLSDDAKRVKHIENIISLVKNSNFDGIEIDYEGKLIGDKDIFSKFLKELSAKLNASGKKLVCTVEARTTDEPYDQVPVKALFPWANDYSVLNDVCDSVRIMAYDEYFTTYGSNSFVTNKPMSVSVSNASLNYVISVLTYTSLRIDSLKIILGIPAYGYEYSVTIKGDKRTVKRVGSYSFEGAERLAESTGSMVKKTVGGEKYFIYTTKSGQIRYVVFSDSETIKDRLDLAKMFSVGGISLFKIDGDEDPKMWEVLR